MCSRPSRNCESCADPIRSTTTIRSRPGRSSLTGACSMSSCVAAPDARRQPALDGGAAASPRSPAISGMAAGHARTDDGWDIDARGDDGAGLPAGLRHGGSGRERSMPSNAPPATEPSAKARAVFQARGRQGLPQARPAGAYHRQLLACAPTLFDYINRAMPMPAPHTLSADDVYALTAYILNLNDIVPSEFVATATVCPKSRCPIATPSSGPIRDPIRRQSLHERMRRPGRVKITSSTEARSHSANDRAARHQ